MVNTDQASRPIPSGALKRWPQGRFFSAAITAPRRNIQPTLPVRTRLNVINDRCGSTPDHSGPSEDRPELGVKRSSKVRFQSWEDDLVIASRGRAAILVEYAPIKPQDCARRLHFVWRDFYRRRIACSTHPEMMWLESGMSAAQLRAGVYDNTQGKTNADRYCEVVQYNERLRVHRT